MIARFDNQPGAMEAILAKRVAAIVRQARRELRLSQRAVASASGIPQTAISRIERGDARHVRLHYVAHVMDTLGVRVELSASGPVSPSNPRQVDLAHARILGQMTRRFAARGWAVEREAPIGGGRTRGWIDLVAWHPDTRTFLVLEAKTSLRDLGALERQVGWYERAAWEVARQSGWTAIRVVVLVASLATAENAAFVAANAASLRGRFGVRANRFQALIDRPISEWPEPARAIAFVDPARVGRRFLLPTPLFAGRLDLPYADAQDFLRRAGGR